jgi:hypothetical protein
MKPILLLAVLFGLALSLPAQTNEPVKLAIVAESSDASAALDILTARLSANNNVHLLERDEIDKVYQEQGKSAENRDDVKLGRLLGADGLLLLDVEILMDTNSMYGIVPSATNLIARLIAVKPGVILADEKYSVGDFVSWSSGYAQHLDSLLPKLAVAPGDAIPISVVNLRSSIQTDQEKETEKDLKSLVIKRLSQEQRFFVLERERMQLLGREKELNSDESAFWDGSYLLEGIVDQNGYSRDIITIDARLDPPKGGAPLLFQVSGSRTNLAEVINQLAANVVKLLNVKSTAPEWNPADEASRFFDEAKWALKWGAYPEAEASADSAWALGKQDLDSATVRVRAYVSAVQANSEKIESLDATYSPTFDSQGNPTAPPPGEAEVQSDIKEEVASHPSGAAYKETHVDKNTTTVQYAFLDQPPDPQNIDQAILALELYTDFSRSSPDGQPKVLTRGPGWNDWHDSDWYKLGIDDLVAASQVLQNFYLSPGSRQPVADKLADLRAQARSVAEFISQSPSVHDGYFVDDRTATHDELANTLGNDNGKNPNIFTCELQWGSLWQEKPEGCISLYRDLAASPAFCYIHNIFWSHRVDWLLEVMGLDHHFEPPRIVAWNEEDQKRIPAIWGSFIQELNDSTNVLWRMEAQGLARADATNDEAKKAAVDNWWNLVRSHREELVGNNVDLFYLGWGFDYNSETEAMDQEYWQKTVPGGQTSSAFEKQKEYLTAFTPFDWNTFNTLFSFNNYSKRQAAELKPLVEAYESNLVTRGASPQDKFKAQSNAHWVDFYLGGSINKILNPPVPLPVKVTAPNIPTPMPSIAIVPKVPAIVPTPPPLEPTNILGVSGFSKIPYDQMLDSDSSFPQPFAERWSEGKLLVGVEYHKNIFEFDANGNWKSTRDASLSAIAIFDPTNESWSFAKCPTPPVGTFSLRQSEDDRKRFILFRGDLYSCLDGPLEKYSFQAGEWRNLEIPVQGKFDLFAVNDRLFGANSDSIFEIKDDGNISILASTRRRPAVTILDSLDDFGTSSIWSGGFSPPELFSSADGSLCASIEQKIYRWDGNDWHDILTLNISRSPEIFDDAVIFRHFSSFGPDDLGLLWIWNKGQSSPELCLADKPRPNPGIMTSPYRMPDNQDLRPLWRSLDNEYLASAPAISYQTNLYFFVEHADVTNSNGQWIVVDKDGYDAKLVCLSREIAGPIALPLKFDAGQGQLPLKILGEKISIMPMDSPILDTILHFSGEKLFFSEQDIGGVWEISVSNIESAMAAQKQIFSAQLAGQKASALRARNEILTKYSIDQDGNISPAEKEAALADRSFIEFELDKIDANHNGILDPEELVYFDANHNKILDANKESGIDIALHLLAERLINRFDMNGTGVLDQREFRAFESSMNIHGRIKLQPGFLPSQNPEDAVNADEIAVLLKQELTFKFRQLGIFQKVMPEIMTDPEFNGQINPNKLFKAEVESYWQNPGGNPPTH